MSKAQVDRRKPGSRPIYVNHTTMTKKTLKEVMRLNWRTGAGWMRIVLLAMAGLALVFALVQLVMYGFAAVGQVLSMVLLSGMSFYLAQWGYSLRAPMYIRGQMSLWGEDALEKTVSFYPEEIMQDSRLGQLHFGYGELRRVLVGKTIMIIKLEDGGLILDRAGFEGVEDEEVVAFLAELTPPPPPKKKFSERLAEAKAGAEAAQAGKGKAPAQAAPSDPAIAALLEDDEDEEEEAAEKGFDITDDSWVDEMDAEEEARHKRDGGAE